MKLKRKRFSDLKESSKISWIYSAITITLVTMAGGIFYALSSNYIENLYFKYLSEKAHAVAIERFEKDELDPVKYRNVVLHRQNSIPTSHQLFVDMEFPEKARNELKEYLSNTQIADVIKGEEVFFHRGDEVDTAMAKGEGLFWVMPVEKVANQIISAIRKKKSKVYVTKRWHILAFIYKYLPFSIFKRL